MKDNKKKVLTIVLSLVAIAALVFACWKLNTPKTAKYDGTIVVEVIDLSGNELAKKSIGFVTGDKIEDLLKNNFENVDIKDGFLYSIDKLTTPEDWSTFICLYVDDQMSEVGILEVVFKDGTKISFIDTEMSW